MKNTFYKVILLYLFLALNPGPIFLLVLLKLLDWIMWQASKCICSLYYKLKMIINDDSRIVNKLEASLTDDARVVIYDRNMFIVQSTGFILRQQFETQASLH